MTGSRAVAGRSAVDQQHKPKHLKTQTPKNPHTQKPRHLRFAAMADVPVFTDNNGQPMVFHIDVLDPQREQYTQLITQHGGLVRNDPECPGNVASLSSFPAHDMKFLFSFVEDAIRKGRVPLLENYRFQKRGYEPELDAVMSQVKKQKTKLTTKFTAEADNYILEQVRMKPRFRTSHKFFEELAQHELLRGHTGNLVRSRYRAHLEHKLEYVYKTDEFDRLVLDANGERIMLPATDSKTIKNRFTAEDDFNLCNDIINHVLTHQDHNTLKYEQKADVGGEFLGKTPVELVLLPEGYYNEDKFSVLISFFDDYARHNPSHLSLLWRDRYRKFARVFGLQRYRDYYLENVKTKEGAQPMKNLTSRQKEDKKRPEKKKTEIDEALAAVGANSHLLTHPHQYNSALDNNAAAAVATMAVSARQDPLDEEIGGVKNSNIHEALRNANAGAGVEDEVLPLSIGGTDHLAIHPNLGGSGVDDDFTLGMKIEESDLVPYAKEMAYLPALATIDDLFLPHYFRHAAPESVVADAVAFVLRLQPDDVGHVFSHFELLGFSRRFTGHILRTTSASVLGVKVFLENMAKHSALTPLHDWLFPRETNGLWTEDYDEALRQGYLDQISFQDLHSIAVRRSFLDLD